MDKNLSEAVERLARDAIDSTLPDVAREAAKATGGLPLYWDIGGVVVLTPPGDVLHYDPETRTIKPFTDRKWQTIALLKASRNHPELAALSPARPREATTCPQCGGTGNMPDIAACGACMGAGWIED